jgi:hypothetical protein
MMLNLLESPQGREDGLAARAERAYRANRQACCGPSDDGISGRSARRGRQCGCVTSDRMRAFTCQPDGSDARIGA